MTHRTQSLMIDALVSVFVAAILIQWSLAHGRLAIFPAYDDVVYLYSGLQFYRDLSVSIRQFVHALCYRPPHAPLTEVLAALSFAVFGVHDWAPYAGNTLLLFVTLRILRQIMVDVPAVYRWCLVMMVLTIPFTDELIIVFRPDLFYGVTLAAALLFVLTQPIVSAGWQRRLRVGLVFGALLLIKTSVYPQTIAMLGLAVVLRSIRDLFGPDNRQSLREIVKTWSAVVVIAIALASIHYAFAFKSINYYIGQTLFGSHSDLWKYHGSLKDTLGFYLFNTRMLGHEDRLIWPLFLIFGTGGFVLGSKSRRWEFGSLALVLLASYLLPTLNKTKSPHLGITFQVLAVWSVLAFANELFHQARQRTNRSGISGCVTDSASNVPTEITAAHGLYSRSKRSFAPQLTRLLREYTSCAALDCRRICHAPGVSLRWLMPLACLIALWQSLLLFAWPAFPDRSATLDPIHNRTVQQLFTPLRANYRKIQHPKLMLTTDGYIISPDLFKYLALKEDNKTLETLPVLFTFDPVIVKSELDQADFVIAATMGTDETDLTIEGNQHADQSLAMVQSRNDLKQLAVAPTVGGGKFYLYINLRSLLGQQYAKFTGFDTAVNLTDVRGPFPQYQLPLCRLGLDSQTTLRFNATSSNPMILDMNVRSMPTNQKLTVTFNGDQIAQFPASEALFSRRSFEITPKIGTNRVQIQYAAIATQGKERIAVMFEALRIVPAPDSVKP